MHVDGARFATQAAERGAVAAVSEANGPAAAACRDYRHGRPAGGRAAGRRVLRHPAERVVGITGTNGKTTTAYLLASIFEAARIRCGWWGPLLTDRNERGHATLPRRRP